MKKRRCSKCGDPKPVTAFAFRNRAKGTRSSVCRDCHKEYAADHYQRNKEAYNNRARKNMPRYREVLKQAILDYLKIHHCVDCLESDPVVLEFDHRDPTSKTVAVAKLINNAVSLDRLMGEIGKCDVRCANCHRRRTAAVFGYYKARLTQ